jgi:hypothetical protein
LIVAAAALIAPLAACGSDDAPAASAGSEDARTASCTDPAGDGGPADLTVVELTETGDALVARYTLTAPLAASSGSALLALAVSSDDGETARQLGAKWVDGQALVFVFDIGAGQTEVEAAPTIEGNTVTVSFPTDAISDLGDSWQWRVTSNINGADVDRCPDGGGDPLGTQSFPG